MIQSMLVFFYGAILLFAIILLFLANQQGSFPLAYLGMALILFNGMMLTSDGVQISSGAVVDDTVSPIVITDTYTTYTVANNWIVTAFANAFFYGGLGLMVGTTFFALRS